MNYHCDVSVPTHVLYVDDVIILSLIFSILCLSSRTLYFFSKIPFVWISFSECNC